MTLRSRRQFDGFFGARASWALHHSVDENAGKTSAIRRLDIF
jgi:hypothetical protein